MKNRMVPFGFLLLTLCLLVCSGCKKQAFFAADGATITLTAESVTIEFNQSVRGFRACPVIRLCRAFPANNITIGSNAAALSADTPSPAATAPALVADASSLAADTPAFMADVPAPAANTPALVADVPASVAHAPALVVDARPPGVHAPTLVADTLELVAEFPSPGVNGSVHIHITDCSMDFVIVKIS